MGFREVPGWWPDEPFRPLDAKPGDKIRPIYEDEERTKVANGYLHEQLHASKTLKDQVYTIKDIKVGAFISYIHLEELPGRYNSCHFKFAKP